MMISPFCNSLQLQALPPKQVVLVDDDERMRRSMERLLTSEGYQVKTFPSAAAFLSSPASGGAACAVLNLDLRDISGLEAQRRMTAGGRGEQVVFYTSAGSISSCVQAMKAGASDYLTRPMTAPQFLGAVENALERSRQWWSQRSCQSEARDLVAGLTRREREVMQLMIRGLMNREIASNLGAAEATIKIHRRRIMDKLSVKSVPEVVLVAQSAGMISPMGNFRTERAGTRGEAVDGESGDSEGQRKSA